MKTFEDIAKESGIDSVDLGNAVDAILANRSGSYLEAESYTKLLSKEFTQAEWDVAHRIANVYEKRSAV